MARNLGAPVMLPPGKLAARAAKCVTSGRNRPCDGGHEVLHLGEAFELREFGHLHAAEFADAPEVITQQVRDHHQLGALLRAGLKFVGECGVAGGIRRTRPRALDRARGNVRSAQPQKLLRRRRGNLEIRPIKYAANGAGDTVSNRRNNSQPESWHGATRRCERFT